MANQQDKQNQAGQQQQRPDQTGQIKDQPNIDPSQAGNKPGQAGQQNQADQGLDQGKRDQASSQENK